MKGNLIQKMNKSLKKFSNDKKNFYYLSKTLKHLEVEAQHQLLKKKIENTCEDFFFIVLQQFLH